MNVYVNKDDFNSLCIVDEGEHNFLLDEGLCTLFVLNDVPKDVIDNCGEYSYLDGAFIKTEDVNLDSIEIPISMQGLLSTKEKLITESSEVLLEYFERDKMIEMGLETDSTLTTEEFQSWSTYRNALKNWDVSVASTPPTR